jgi:hypothetical protein|nr:MAG TPA: hypothetical protein [Caudoviricetes sp.]DAP65216.1 MAG TPA: hypothetical protein [Caudoviricetes sp.]
MKLEKYATALNKAKSLLESASTVDALNREMSDATQTITLENASKKFAKIRKEVLSRFSSKASVKLEGSNVVITAPRKASLQYILKRFNTTTNNG